MPEDEERFGSPELSKENLDELIFEKAKIAIATGRNDSMAYYIASSIMQNHPKHAAILLERCMNAGDSQAAMLLANLVKGSDPEKAKEAYSRAIELGNTRLAPYYLGQMLKVDDPQRAIELFKMAVDAGDERGSTFSLGNLLWDRDPRQSALYYKRALNAGHPHALERLAALLH